MGEMDRREPRTAEELKSLLSGEQSEARRLLGLLFDAGTFVELGAYVRRASEGSSGFSDSEFEGVVTGYGAVDGRLVFAYAQDRLRDKGVWTAAHAGKINRLYQAARKSRAPVVAVLDSAGVLVPEGTSALAGYADVMRTVCEARNEIPQIAAVRGICAGAEAALAAMYDFTVMQETDGKLFVAPPFVLREKNKGESFGTCADAKKLGLVSLSGGDDAALMAKTAALVSRLPSDSRSGTVSEPGAGTAGEPDLATASLVGQPAYDMKQVIASVADSDTFLELKEEYAPEMITGFAALNGRTVGIAANNPSVRSGALTAAAAKKAAQFISFCNRFSVPLLTLVDTVGTELSAESERAPYAEALAGLAEAYAAGKMPKVTAILGNAFGSAYICFGSRAVGADVVFAADTARIGSMQPDGAVEFLYADEIRQAEEPLKKRAELLAEWNAVMVSPEEAARNGEVDDIVSAADIRGRAASAFEMLAYGE